MYLGIASWLPLAFWTRSTGSRNISASASNTLIASLTSRSVRPMRISRSTTRPAVYVDVLKTRDVPFQPRPLTADAGGVAPQITNPEPGSHTEQGAPEQHQEDCHFASALGLLTVHLQASIQALIVRRVRFPLKAPAQYRADFACYSQRQLARSSPSPPNTIYTSAADASDEVIDDVGSHCLGKACPTALSATVRFFFA